MKNIYKIIKSHKIIKSLVVTGKINLQKWFGGGWWCGGRQWILIERKQHWTVLGLYDVIGKKLVSKWVSQRQRVKAMVVNMSFYCHSRHFRFIFNGLCMLLPLFSTISSTIHSVKNNTRTFLLTKSPPSSTPPPLKHI